MNKTQGLFQPQDKDGSLNVTDELDFRNQFVRLTPQLTRSNFDESRKGEV